MGGSGSGRWGGHCKRRTVESCQLVEVRPGGRIVGRFNEGAWRLSPMNEGDQLFLTLERNLNGRKVLQAIEVMPWSPPLGGRAFWLSCPLCRRNFRKLFAPPGQFDFRCRQCWGLAYQSSQEAHLWDRGFALALLAPILSTGIKPSDVERAMRRSRPRR